MSSRWKRNEVEEKWACGICTAKNRANLTRCSTCKNRRRNAEAHTPVFERNGRNTGQGNPNDRRVNYRGEGAPFTGRGNGRGRGGNTRGRGGHVVGRTGGRGGGGKGSGRKAGDEITSGKKKVARYPTTKVDRPSKASVIALASQMGASRKSSNSLLAEALLPNSSLPHLLSELECSHNCKLNWFYCPGSCQAPDYDFSYTPMNLLVGDQWDDSHLSPAEVIAPADFSYESVRVSDVFDRELLSVGLLALSMVVDKKELHAPAKRKKAKKLKQEARDAKLKKKADRIPYIPRPVLSPSAKAKKGSKPGLKLGRSGLDGYYDDLDYWDEFDEDEAHVRPSTSTRKYSEPLSRATELNIEAVTNNSSTPQFTRIPHNPLGPFTASSSSRSHAPSIVKEAYVPARVSGSSGSRSSSSSSRSTSAWIDTGGEDELARILRLSQQTAEFEEEQRRKIQRIMGEDDVDPELARALELSRLDAPALSVASTPSSRSSIAPPSSLRSSSPSRPSAPSLNVNLGDFDDFPDRFLEEDPFAFDTPSLAPSPSSFDLGDAPDADLSSLSVEEREAEELRRVLELSMLVQ